MAVFFLALAFCLGSVSPTLAGIYTWSAPVSMNGLSANQILTAPAGTIVGAVGFGVLTTI